MVVAGRNVEMTRNRIMVKKGFDLVHNNLRKLPPIFSTTLGNYSTIIGVSPWAMGMTPQPLQLPSTYNLSHNLHQ